jgi:hypothetical protein
MLLTAEGVWNAAERIDNSGRCRVSTDKMKVMVATAMLALLIAAGWNRSYGQQLGTFTTVYNQLLMKLRPQPETIPQPTPEPEATAVVTPPISPVAPTTPSGGHGSWMWSKSVLDNPRQSGVDRSGVHSNERMLQNH